MLKWACRPTYRKARLPTSIIHGVSLICNHFAGVGSNLQSLNSGWILSIKSKAEAPGQFSGEGCQGLLQVS